MPEKSSATQTLLVLCTCPPDKAAELAQFLVEAHLAACVNILPQLHSVYRWEGQVFSEAESLLFIKTERATYPELERRLRERHPYEVPEIVAMPIERGLPDYLQWISSCLSTGS
jgi:periplasmic divalent cation tolerance protein